MMQNSDSINARKYNRNCVQLRHQERHQALPGKRLRTTMGREAGKDLGIAEHQLAAGAGKP